MTAPAWPEPTRLFVLRHGQTAWNAGGRLQGHLDIPLDDTGRRQAAQAAQALAGESLAVVYSSDLLRARDTAQPLATATAAPLVTDVRLRERSFGSFEGLTYDEVEQQWPDEALRWRRREPGFRPGGGESLSDFYRRSVDTVLALAAAHAGEAIAVVAHGGVLDCLYRAATGIDLSAPRTWQVGNASINRLLCTGERLQMVGWSDTGHLEGDALT